VFSGVWFRYGDDWTLRDVSFTVPHGSTTALVGETGSGKTTLGYLAARLYDVTRGSVTVDGVDIRDLSFAALSDLVGVVSQETYLFHATVRENLRFAKPEATDEEIEAAAAAARIHHVISALPDGYDTVVGERGYRFSDGEPRRPGVVPVIGADGAARLVRRIRDVCDRRQRSVAEQLQCAVLRRVPLLAVLEGDLTRSDE